MSQSQMCATAVVDANLLHPSSFKLRTDCALQIVAVFKHTARAFDDELGLSEFGDSLGALGNSVLG